MSEQKPPCIGVWCGRAAEAGLGHGDPELFGTVHREKDKEAPLLLFTLRRLKPLGWPLYALVPWIGSLDHLAHEVVTWGFPVRRTSPEKAVAMRDLVAQLMSPYGCLVDGACAVVDADELRLAVARMDAFESEQYRSMRVDARSATGWLAEEDKDAWPLPMSRLDAARFFDGKAGTASAREIKARAAEQRPLTD